ncbi:MAG: hypothetical protein GY822_00835 [Deltaproteobacteria bacterium]|nr:hypothetical protein [Deltaproteobacteria bacterium]
MRLATRLEIVEYGGVKRGLAILATHVGTFLRLCPARPRTFVLVDAGVIGFNTAIRSCELVYECLSAFDPLRTFWALRRKRGAGDEKGGCRDE